MKTITATLEWSKDGYGIWFEEFPNIFSFAQFEDRSKKPLWLKTGFEISIRFDTASFLNHYQYLFTKRALSKITGINKSLLSQYAIGLKKPRPKQSKKNENGIHELARELQRINLI